MQWNTSRSTAMLALTAVLALGPMTGPAAAGPLQERQTASGYPFVVGGIGDAEQQALNQVADKYSLQIVMATRAGSYVADTEVQIRDQSGKVVIDTNADAPWLMVDVPPGRYTVTASFSGQQVQRQVAVPANEPRRVYLHFNDVED